MVDSIRRWTRVRPATLALVVGLGLALGGCAQAPKSSPATGPTSAKRLPAPSLTDDPGYTPAEPAPARHTDDLGRALQRDAPRRYVVQPGDTLWDIAGRYLRAPWYWQQLWQANPNLAAPDRIYPGDVLVLSKDMDGTPHLTRERRTVRLSPQVRTAPLDSAIPTIPVASLRAFLQSPRRVAAAELAHAPYVVAVGDGQLVAGNDARLYIRGLGADAPSRLALVRPDSAYAWTDVSADRSPRAIPVGEVEILRQAAEPAEEISGNGEADIATARFVRALREARPGDRLLPIREAALGVGASKMQTVFHHVLPLAAPGILTGTIIGLAQALGETAPLLLIGMVGFIARAYPEGVVSGFVDPNSAMPAQIYTWAARADAGFYEKAWGGIIILLIFLLTMNIIAIILRRRFERRW